MDLGRRDIDTNVKYSGSLQAPGDSHPITSGLRVVMKPARDRVDGYTSGSREIVGEDIGVCRPSRFPDLNLPGHGTEQIIGGIGAADRLVGIQYELTAAGSAEKRAKARRNNLGYEYGRECGIVTLSRDQQHYRHNFIAPFRRQNNT